MSETPTMRGTCLCGACGFDARPEGPAGVCHCGQCNRWSGGMYMNVMCGSSVRFDEGAPLGRYRASEWGERVFCRDCGSSLMWQLQDGTHQHVSIHAFDDPAQFEIGLQVFIDRKPESYALAGETKVMTEAEVFAMFGGQS